MHEIIHCEKRPAPDLEGAGRLHRRGAVAFDWRGLIPNASETALLRDHSPEKPKASGGM